MTPPIIGITQSSKRDHPRTLQEYLSLDAYYRVIRQAGGIPTSITSTNFQAPTTPLDGILFSGGGDVSPSIYGDATFEYISGVDDQRDQLETELLQWVIDKDIPFLGICRGLQLINVAQGGSLYRDLALQMTGSIIHDWHPSRRLLAHEISLNPDNPLIDAGFTHSFSVNSLHHQGVRSIGKGLSVIAQSPDGVIEALQLTGHRFGLAVQWHPEWLTDQQPTRDLFVNFINTCERTHP